MAAAKPTKPPSGADMNALIVSHNEMRLKLGLQPLVSQLQKWKRWVGGEAEYDGTGLRDVVNADALYLDQVKADLDKLDAREAAHNTATDNRLDRLEAAQSFSPFPESS